MANVKELEIFLQMIIISMCVACHDGVMLFLQSAHISFKRLHTEKITYDLFSSCQKH